MTANHDRTRSVNNRGSGEWLPLDTARDTFTWLVTGAHPLSLDGRLFPGLPNRLVPLDEVRDRLLRRGCPRRTHDAVWTHLVLRSRGEGATWTVACVGMALPALASSAGWLAARYRGERADVHAAVLAGFLEALATVEVGPPGVLSRLRWAARRAGQAALEESLDAPIPTALGFRWAPPRSPGGHPDLVLARAVAEGVLTPTEADLIGTTRLERVPLADWARAHNAGLKTTYSTRDRAEQRLVTYLRDNTRDPDEPVLPAMVAATRLASASPPPTSPPELSLAVSGRRRNGRPASVTTSSPPVRKTHSGSGLMRCGDSTPTSARPRPSSPSSEVSPCA
jgi:hypothetical protein